MEKALIAFIPLHAFQVIHNIIILQENWRKICPFRKKRILSWPIFWEKRKFEYRAKKQPQGF